MVFLQPFPHMAFYRGTQRVFIRQIRFLSQLLIDISRRPHRPVAGGSNHYVGPVNQRLAVYFLLIESTDHQLYICQSKACRIFIIIHQDDLIAQLLCRFNRRNLEHAPSQNHHLFPHLSFLPARAFFFPHCAFYTAYPFINL